jgi:hypothetical protein
MLLPGSASMTFLMSIRRSERAYYLELHIERHRRSDRQSSCAERASDFGPAGRDAAPLLERPSKRQLVDGIRFRVDAHRWPTDVLRTNFQQALGRRRGSSTSWCLSLAPTLTFYII